MPKKKAKNNNTLQHGVYSNKVLLPGEKQADYGALRQSYFDEWVPFGVTEQYLVDDLCKLRWKKLRLERYDQVCLQQRKDKIRLENNANKLIEELRGLAEEFSETESIEEVEGILPSLSASINMLINQWVPRDKCTEPAKWGQEIGDYLSKLKQVNPLKGADLFAAIVDPGLMEIEIARSGRLDEAIDRTIKRLMQVKAAKQVFPNMRKHAKPEPKLISAPENAAAQPALVFEKQLKPAQTLTSAKLAAEDSAKGGVVIQGSCIDEGGPRPVTSTPIANEPPALFAANESKPATLTEVVISAKPDVEGTEFTAEAFVVPEESYLNSYLNEGEPPPSSTPIANEQPALFAANESQPATPAASVISGKPAVEGREFAAEAGVVPEESYISEGEPPPVSQTPITNEPPALFATNELKPATLTAAVIPAKPEVEGREFAAEAGLVLEGSHIGESGPAPVLSHPIMVEQPAMVAENQLKPASPNERVISVRPELQTFTAKAGVVLKGSQIGEGRPASVPSTPIMVEQPAVVAENQLKPASPNATAISAKPEVQTFTTKAGVVLQGAPIEEGVPAPVSSCLSKKVYFGLLHGIDEVLAEQPPFCLEELHAFSALCNEIFRSNASNNPTSPPGAGAA